MKEKIFIKGARVHNLKNIDVEIPRNKFVVITGVSGSGKSSLAFDTLYAEGQRRYVESLSAYARQFLGLMEKPDVDYIEGLSPAISIEQRKASKNPRSTVATVTEIYDYLRLLFARIGIPHCPNDNTPLEKRSLDEIVDEILKLGLGMRLILLAPVIRGRKGEYRELFERYLRRGFLRARVDGEIYELEDPPVLERYKTHTIEIVVDRIELEEDIRSRLAESVETALKEADGIVKVVTEEGEEFVFSEKLMCPKCGFSMEEIEPRLFSFNSPYGACPYCSGLGVKYEIDPSRLVTSSELSILEGALKPWGEPNPFLRDKLERIARHYHVDLDLPWADLPQKFKNVVLYGTEYPEKFDPERPHASQEFYFYEGLVPYLWRRYYQTESDWVKDEIEKFMLKKVCPACGGSRLKREALFVKIRDHSIWDIVQKTVEEALEFFLHLQLRGREYIIGKQILKEIIARLRFLKDVGVGYLTLDRATETLSAGEEQRVRLATQIGSGLVGVLYVLDEPSIGLHPRDMHRLIDTLINLKEMGNTVVVVEHDKATIEAADWVIDLGPGAGEKGGKIVATGTPEDIKKNKRSLTGQYLAGLRKIPIPKKRRKPQGKWLVIKGARQNNLKNIDVKFPLGLFICVTGVSGSGKSSLVEDTLYRALMRRFYGSREPVGEHDKIEGLEYIDKVINIDQSPIGRTPRSNPGTYTSAFTPIRELFANLKESRKRGYSPGRFSFNVKGGRCEACKGEGFIKVEMQFLPDIYIPCEVCKGKRYNRETLEVKYKDKSIADVLDMSVDEAYKLFKDIPQIERKLKLLKDVGLGYIKLGQPATTLSGGEAQRIKLAKELSKVATGKTLYILDEPTTGLHFEDVKKLINVLNKLVDKGNTVIIIEHNLDIVKSADWIIDLGPEGGNKGGYIVAEGPPEKVAEVQESYTGRYLREELKEKFK
ncbi:MAG TPA: excinuclease ABC subunit UvrA [Candidatus Altiarchaeales archaeon]|nr:excinuclease ABC subunit UvrA [Candidatus Altiarchaeales archaeon]